MVRQRGNPDREPALPDPAHDPARIRRLLPAWPRKGKRETAVRRPPEEREQR